MLDFADVSSPSLMDYGQFTDLQRTSFTFRFSLSESNGFSGPEQSPLNSDAIVAHGGRPQGVPLPGAGSITKSCPNSMHLPWVRADYVGLCRVRSRQVAVILFFWTYMLDFANGSSPSLINYGQLNYGPFTDFQRSYFAFRFSLSESHGFSGPEQSHLNSDAIVAHEVRPLWAPLVGAPTRFRQHHEVLSQFDAFALG